jgi:hypothetical protein
VRIFLRRAAPRRALLLLLLLAASAVAGPVAGQERPAPAAATVQSSGVQGRITDASSGRPVGGAAVTISAAGGLTSSAVADDSGRFAVRGLSPSTRELTLRVRALGYQPAERRVQLAVGYLVELDVALVPAPYRLAEVRTQAVAPERQQFEQTPDAGGVRVTRGALAALPALGEADVLRTVQLMPGVLARNDYTAGYNVRGGEADQNLVLLDGIPIYNPFHLFGLFGTFIDETVADVSLTPGGFPAQFGGRLSSVLEVTSAEEARQGVHGAASVSLLASALTLGGAMPDARTTWGVAARRTYVDVFADAFTQQEVPYHFQDAQLRARRFLRGGGSLTLTAYAGSDVVDGNFAALGPESDPGGGTFVFDWGNRLAGLTWSQPVGAVGDSAELLTQAAVTQFRTGLDLGAGTLVLANRVTEGRVIGSLRVSAGSHQRRVGYELSHYRVRYSATAGPAASPLFALRQRPTAGAIYADEQWRTLGGRLLMRAGLRGEHVSGTGWYGVSPRVALKYFQTRDLAWTVAGGQHAQWVHSLSREDIPVRLFDFWVASDPWVPVATARDLSVGAEWWSGAARFARVQLFGRRFSNLAEPAPSEDEQVRGDKFVVAGGRAYGAELLLRQLESERLSGWLAYTYAVSTREGPDGGYWPGQDRRHNLNLVSAYRMGRGYVLGARFGLGTGTPYTPLCGEFVRRIYDGTRNAFDTGLNSRTIQPVGCQRNSERYPLYHRLDVSGTRSYRRGSTTLTPFISVVNVLNRKNVFIYTRNFSVSPPTQNAISQLPLLPTAGLSVEF